ncbi:MAG: TolC family protein [Flavobacteriaceae bacterium]|nr:TolC family protein [Flavobacteriaceae bacterium]
MKKVLNILLIFFLIAINVTAQEELTISSAIKKTLENNLDIEVSENFKRIAKNNSSILNNNYLPNIQLGSEINTNIQSIEIETPSGISGTLDDTQTDNSSAVLSIDYNIIDASGRKYNYKKSKELYSKSNLEVQEIIENTILQLFTVFFEVGRLSEEKEILKNSLDISKRRYERRLLEYEYGQTNNLEVLNAEVDVNSDSINLLNTSKKLFNARSDLNLIMNVDLESEFNINTNINFLDQDEINNIFSNDIYNNTRLLIIEKDIIISNLERKIAKSSYLPTLGLIGSYGWNESINDNPYAFYNKSISDGFSAGINIRWDIFRGGKKIIANKNAEIVQENSELTKKKTVLELKKELRNAYQTHLNNLFILEVQRKNLSTNKNNFDRNIERYKIGQVSSIEFRRAQLNLLNAELSESSAKYQAKISEAYFLKISGEIISKFK